MYAPERRASRLAMSMQAQQQADKAQASSAAGGMDSLDALLSGAYMDTPTLSKLDADSSGYASDATSRTSSTSSRSRSSTLSRKTSKQYLDAMSSELDALLSGDAKPPGARTLRRREAVEKKIELEKQQQ